VALAAVNAMIRVNENSYKPREIPQNGSLSVNSRMIRSTIVDDIFRPIAKPPDKVDFQQQ